MMNRLWTILIWAIVSTQTYAFPCFITIAKDGCWTKYNVTVNVFDASNNKQVASVIIPAGSSWARQSFSCNPQQKLRFQAQFTPVFWADDEGKTYSGQNYWTLPDQVAKGDTAWNISLCYPKEFSEVPFPPEGTANCKCDTSGIPPVPPQ